jgi:hypothetical protein
MERKEGFEPFAKALEEPCATVTPHPPYWCWPSGSHGDIAAFNGAQGLPLLDQRVGGRSWIRTNVSFRDRGYEPRDIDHSSILHQW